MSNNLNSMPLYYTRTATYRWHQYQGADTNDCAAFSIAIVANAILDRLQFDGFKVAREMEKWVIAHEPLPHPTLRKIPGYASLPWGISGYLKSQGFPARLRWLGTLDDLLRNLQEDRLTIVIIGGLLRDGRSLHPPRFWGHAKVLWGFEPAAGPAATAALQPQPGFYFVDPGIEKGMSGLPRLPTGVARQDEAEFRKEWGNLLRIYIEAGPRVA